MHLHRYRNAHTKRRGRHKCKTTGASGDTMWRCGRSLRVGRQSDIAAGVETSECRLHSRDQTSFLYSISWLHTCTNLLTSRHQISTRHRSHLHTDTHRQTACVRIKDEKFTTMGARRTYTGAYPPPRPKCPHKGAQTFPWLQPPE